MSRENVEIVRRAVDAMVSGDAGTALASLDPEIECRTARSAQVQLGCSEGGSLVAPSGVIR